MSADLIAFLRARLDEDEEVARLAEAVDPSPWYEDVEDGTYTNQRDGLDGVGLVRAADNVGLWDREQSCTLSMAAVTAVHVARHDPARILAEVEAKRRIVEQWATHEALDRETFEAEGEHARSLVSLRAAYWDACRELAAVYADHPDYRAEWAPEGSRT